MDHESRHHIRLLAVAKQFDGDGTDRADRIRSAVDELRRLGALRDLEASATLYSLVWHILDGLDPARQASRRGGHASAFATAGRDELVAHARELAKLRSGDKSRAATVRAILPDLQRYRDTLRAKGHPVPNLSTDRALRTVSDWIKQ